MVDELLRAPFVPRFGYEKSEEKKVEVLQIFFFFLPYMFIFPADNIFPEFFCSA